ncbi:UDP-N-acetylmuramate--L-alanine ligase [bacterium]|nr:UDP-N-acetylmuramate--L-alanine ligase [bacterium]
MFGRTRRLHMVGIGGIGMSGIAEVLINLGFDVTGSDRQLTPITDHLKQLGAGINASHEAENVKGADVVVISSAIKEDNPEVRAAHELGIPVIRRAEMLAELMRMKYGIAIAGTHGKTTTSSMTGLVLQEGQLDPTLIIGGKLKSLKTNAKLGSGKYVVVEADEYDRSFLQLTPTLAVITNIESEHLDCYKDLDDIKNSFISFANKVPFFGAVFVCLDEVSLQEIVPRLKRRIVTYGLTPQADVRATEIKTHMGKSEFTLLWKEERLGRIMIQLPGEYNIKNALAAVAVGIELEIPFEQIKAALMRFTGVHRRFEMKAEINDILVVDDYAHHPTEIKACLKGAREGWDRRIIAVFQPHLYSRTRDFSTDFGKSFFDADLLVVTDVYAAREEPIPGVSGALVAEAARSLGHRHVVYVPDLSDLPLMIKKEVKPGDLVITMGAGDIWKTGEELIEILGR